MSITSIVLAGLCSAWVLYDIFIAGRRQKMKVMDAVWPITLAYSGPLGFWAYLRWGRAEGAGNHPMRSPRPFWQRVLLSSTHCGAGCAAADLVVEWGVFWLGITIAGEALWANYLIEYFAALAVGILFQYAAIMPMKRLSRWQGLSEAAKADFLSLSAFQIGMYAWMALARFTFFKSIVHPTEPVYWLMMQIGMVLGLATTFPVNWVLVRKRIKEGM